MWNESVAGQRDAPPLPPPLSLVQRTTTFPSEPVCYRTAAVNRICHWGVTYSMAASIFKTVARRGHVNDGRQRIIRRENEDALHHSPFLHERLA